MHAEGRSIDIFPGQCPPLQQPEIVRAMLLHLRDDSKSLYAAVCVNRTWFYEGVGLLWARPAERALPCVAPSSGRRQFYANWMAELSDADGVSAADGLRFPNVRAVRFWQAEWLLAMLPLTSAHVGDVRFALPDGVIQRALAQRARDMPGRLPHLSMPDLNGGVANTARLLHGVFCAMAQLEQLTALVLGENLSSLQRATVEAVVDRAAAASRTSSIHNNNNNNNNVNINGCGGSTAALQPFRHLRLLDVWIEADAVPILVKMLHSITSLCLRTGYDTYVVIGTVAPLEQLQSLELTFSGGAELSAGDLLALQNLTRLRSLSLRYANAWYMPDHCFKRLLSRLPHLQTLVFWCTPPEGSNLLRICGECCPLLCTVSIWGYYSLFMQLERGGSSDRPLFPKLEALSIGGVSTLGEPDLRASTRVAWFENHAFGISTARKDMLLTSHSIEEAQRQAEHAAQLLRYQAPNLRTFKDGTEHTRLSIYLRRALEALDILGTDGYGRPERMPPPT